MEKVTLRPSYVNYLMPEQTPEDKYLYQQLVQAAQDYRSPLTAALQKEPAPMQNTLITAMQIERGMRIYRTTTKAGHVRNARTFLEFKGTPLVAIDDGNSLQIVRVVKEEESLSLSQVAAVSAWLVGNVDHLHGVAAQWRKEENQAERRLVRSQALREAKEAIANLGVSSEELFRIEGEKEAE